MRGTRIAGIVLLVAGVVVLAVRGFSYTKERHGADIGPIQVQVEEKEHVDLPVWLGVGLAAAGGALLLLGSRR